MCLICVFSNEMRISNRIYFQNCCLVGGGGGLEEILKLWFGFYGRFVVRLDCSIEDA